jgi:sugar lactone lactonase YvrE
MDPLGRLYLSALEENAIKIREPDGRIVTVVRDDRLRWPDSFAQAPDGTMYVTSSRIQDSAWFKPATGPQLTTQLWSFSPPSPAQDQTTGSKAPPGNQKQR